MTGVKPHQMDSFNNTLNNFTTIEGPVWIGDALYVSEFPGSPNPPPSRILKVTSAGEVSVAVTGSGSNGLAVDDNGIDFDGLQKNDVARNAGADFFVGRVHETAAVFDDEGRAVEFLDIRQRLQQRSGFGD